MGLIEESNNVAGQNSPLTVQSTLNLKKGDQIWLQIDGMSSGAYLYDSDYHYAHFTSFILEEEIVASLWGFKILIIHEWSKNGRK